MILINSILTIIFILIIDIIWLFINFSNYNNLIKNIQGSNISLNYLGGCLSYITLILAIFIFSIPLIEKKIKENKNQSLIYLCILYGGSLGFLMYSMFNTTNIAIFKKYDYKIAIIDSIWGFMIFTLGTYFYFSIKHII